jgi:hypothetical protein
VDALYILRALCNLNRWLTALGELHDLAKVNEVYFSIYLASRDTCLFLCPWMDGTPEMQEHFPAMALMAGTPKK